MEENLTPEEYGELAYENGLTASWQDTAFINTLTPYPSESNIKRLGDWIKGWTKARDIFIAISEP